MRKLSSKAQQIINDTEQSTTIDDEEITDPSEVDMEVDSDDDGLPNYFNELDGIQC